MQDAQAIDPEVAYVELRAQGDGVADGTREAEGFQGERAGRPEGGHAGGQGAKDREGALEVAEGDVAYRARRGDDVAVAGVEEAEGARGEEVGVVLAHARVCVGGVVALDLVAD